MSKLLIEKGFFTTKDEVLQDIRKSGFWPTTFISDSSPELPIHYHEQDILGYVMSGKTYVLDEDGQRIDIGPGDKLTIPKGAWHAEGKVDETVVYIVTLPDPTPFHVALDMKEPKGPWPPASS